MQTPSTFAPIALSGGRTCSLAVRKPSSYQRCFAQRTHIPQVTGLDPKRSCTHRFQHGLSTRCAIDTPAASEAEEAANNKRWQESGGGLGPADQWRWSLNWNTITPEIIVGSCPRSPSDIDRMVDEANISAIICLQSDACFEAMQIDWPVIRQQAIKRGVTMTRVAVRDFDHNDQALMLPEAVRLLHLLVSSGKHVYVHCTAGINRATLTTVGYLTFVKGMELEAALQHVKTARSQANPYVDCWKRVRARLVADRSEEVQGLARAIYTERQAAGTQAPTDGFADWVEAEKRVIKTTFERQAGCTSSLLASVQELHDQKQQAGADAEGKRQAADGEVQQLKAQLQHQQQQTQQASREAQAANDKLQALVSQAGQGSSAASNTQKGQTQGQPVSNRASMQEVAAASLPVIGGDDEDVGSKHRALTQHGTAKAAHSASQPAKHAHADGAKTAVQGNVHKA